MHNPLRYPHLSSALDSSTQRVLATAAARVYYAPFSTPHLNWTYSKLAGILVFGRDRDAHHTTTSTPHHNQDAHESRPRGKYWFRLVDAKTDRVIWMYHIPEVFEYTRDKPFFHYFSGTSRMLGLCFHEDEEANVLFKTVSDRTRRHFFRPFLFKSAKRDARKKDEAQRAPRSSPVRSGTISSPAPHSFVHVAHVGISTRGIVETAKDIDPPNWPTLSTDLQGHGVTPKIIKDNRDFVEGFLAGAKSMMDKSAAAQRQPVMPPSATPAAKKHQIKRKPVTVF